jgi:DnaJ-class molecular chaperone
MKTLSIKSSYILKCLFILAIITNKIMCEDFYQLLNIDRDTSVQGMKSAYRKQSAIYHPDKNPGDKGAQQMFIKITKAYQTLSNPDKRQIYDIYGEDGLDNEQAMAHSNKERGHNAHVDVDVELSELYNGSTKTISIQKNVVCKQCHGTGGKLGQTKKCTKCHGKGQVIEDVDTGMGFMFKMQNECTKCGGKGIIFKEKCSKCHGHKVLKEDKTLTVEVEKGMKDREKITFKGESEQTPETTPGDLIITLKQKPHKFFTKREGQDLYAGFNLNLKEAILGYERTFKHLDNRKITVKKNVPTQPFEFRTIASEGMPHLNNASYKGNLYIKQEIRLPTRLTEEEKLLIDELFE